MEQHVYSVKEVKYTGRRPYLRMSGIQNRLLTPCMSAVVVKKYAILAMAGPNAGVVGSTLKKVKVISTIATVGPAAKKLQKNTAMQTTPAM